MSKLIDNKEVMKDFITLNKYDFIATHREYLGEYNKLQEFTINSDNILDFVGNYMPVDWSPNDLLRMRGLLQGLESRDISLDGTKTNQEYLNKLCGVLATHQLLRRRFMWNNHMQAVENKDYTDSWNHEYWDSESWDKESGDYSELIKTRINGNDLPNTK